MLDLYVLVGFTSKNELAVTYTVACRSSSWWVGEKAYWYRPLRSWRRQSRRSQLPWDQQHVHNNWKNDNKISL